MTRNNYSFDFKLKVVKAYLNGEGGQKKLAKKFGLSGPSLVAKWVFSYRHFGEEALKPGISYKNFPVQTKLDVINYKLTTGKSYPEVALKFGIHDYVVVSHWIQLWRKKGMEGLSGPKECPCMRNHKGKSRREKELERENELLRAENAYLKKLRASGVNIPSRLLKQNRESSTNSEKNSN